MKFLFITMAIFIGCNQEQAPKPIVEENDMCICTKEYKPVCAAGIEYPNACQAGCEGHTEYTEGSCQAEPI